MSPKEKRSAFRHASKVLGLEYSAKRAQGPVNGSTGTVLLVFMDEGVEGTISWLSGDEQRGFLGQREHRAFSHPLNPDAVVEWVKENE